MKEAVISVHGMLRVMDGRGVEKRLCQHPGIHRVDANYLNGTATVHYDESVINLAEIQALVEACGYHCTGQSLPAHACKPEDSGAGHNFEGSCCPC